jgi:hypothetical protein
LRKRSNSGRGLNVLARTILLAILFAAGAFPGSSSNAAEPEALFATAATGSKVVVDHSIWTGLLAKYVKPDGKGLNRVDYASFRANGRELLREYLAQLEKVKPATLDRPEQFALLANLYNAKTIEIVLEHYPVTSIKDISLGGSVLSVVTGGPWKKKVVELDGTALSLDDLEHGILRPVFRDPRVHYALNCASIGCPNLRIEAFSGEKLEAQLDAAAREFINSSRGVDLAGGKLRVSSIYSWFIEDFGGDDKGLLAHLKRYASEPLAAQLSTVTGVDDHFYDWKLNDVSR